MLKLIRFEFSYSVEVLDTNEFAPVFQNLPYEASVQEGGTSPEFVFRVSGLTLYQPMPIQIQYISGFNPLPTDAYPNTVHLRV